MRRFNLPNYRTALLTTLILLVGAAGPGLAAARLPGDQRPPLLASERAPEGVPAASRLVDFNVVPGDSGIELVLRGDGGLPYELFALTAPDRLVFDLPGVAVTTGRTRAEVGANGVIRVRVGQNRGGPEPIARVVLELDHPLAYQIDRDGDAVRVHLAELNSNVGAAAKTSAERGDGLGALIAAEGPQHAAAVPAPPRPAPLPASDEHRAGDAPQPERAHAAVETIPASAAGPTASDTPHSVARTIRTRDESATSPTLADVAPPTPVDAAPSTPVTAAPTSTPAPDVRAAPEAESARRPAPHARPTDAGIPFAPAATEQPSPPPPVEKEVAGGSATGSMGNPVETEVAGGSATSGIRLPNAETKTIQDRRRNYTGRPVNLNLMDADIRQVFSLFHELSGLNFVLDPAVSGTVTIVVDEVPWDQALDLILQNNGLEMSIEGNVIRIAPVVKLAQEAAARKTLREAKELEANPVTITRTLSYAKASEVDPVIRQAILSPNGRVIVDNRTNTLIIRDIPDRVEAIDKLLTTLDAETPQVMIEARMVEVSRDFVEDLGVKWGASAVADPSLGTQTNLQFPHRARVDYALNLPRNPAANALSFSFGNVLNSFSLDLTLDALETEGYARRLSTPKIATQNNEPAEIEQGVRFPVFKTSATEIQTEFVAAALRMKVTPQITAEGTVVLDIEVSNDQPDFVSSVNGIPSINTQRARTKVLISDGGTTVIGGIFTVNEGRSTSGVPFFGKIPGLGWLFRAKKVENHNRELLIFITSRIIKAA